MHYGILTAHANYSPPGSLNHKMGHTPKDISGRDAEG